ncbi:MAG: glutathione S-transferase [Saprospiraceae bacterium]|jgi:glutathione S-transferase
MKLYGHPDSGHAFKIKFCLSAADFEHDYEVIDIFSPRETRNPDFVCRSKFCEVPLLVDGEQSLIQSGAILTHIAQKHQLFGGESEAVMQHCLQWLLWEANKIGMCLPQLRAHQKFSDSKLGEGAKQWLENRYTHDVGVLNNELQDGRPFILGDSVTIADFALSGYLFFADEAKVNVPSHVDTWLSTLSKLEGWAKPADLLA